MTHLHGVALALASIAVDAVDEDATIARALLDQLARILRDPASAIAAERVVVALDALRAGGRSRSSLPGIMVH